MHSKSGFEKILHGIRAWICELPCTDSTVRTAYNGRNLQFCLRLCWVRQWSRISAVLSLLLLCLQRVLLFVSTATLLRSATIGFLVAVWYSTHVSCTISITACYALGENAFLPGMKTGFKDFLMKDVPSRTRISRSLMIPNKTCKRVSTLRMWINIVPTTLAL